MFVECVVTPVHPGCDDSFFQNILQPCWNIQITVVKLGSTGQEDVEDYQTCQRRPPEKDHETFYAGGYDQFSDMKSCRGCDIDFHIAVMGLVETPKEPNPVICPVHPVIPEIENYYRAENFGSTVKSEEMSEACLVNRGIGKGGINRPRHNRIENQAVSNAYPEMEKNAKGFPLFGAGIRKYTFEIKKRPQKSEITDYPQQKQRTHGVH
jgi:hypothetical protein